MKPTLFPKSILILTVLLGFFFQPFVKAQEDNRNPILTSKFEFGIGVFSPSQVIRLGANGSTENDEIDFGNAFDLKSRSYRPNANLMWRFFKRWRLYGEYFNFDRSNERMLEKDIHWRDYTLKEGSYVKAGLGLDVFRILVGYTVLDKHNQNLILGLGAHTLGIKPHLEGEAYINDESVYYKNKTIYTLAPLPDIIARYTFAINSKWALSGKVDWLSLKVGEYSGGLWDVGPSVSYQPIKHLSLNLDYRYFKVYGNVNKTHWDGSFYLQFKGPTLSVNANF